MNTSRHLRMLALVLVIAGLGFALYQVFILKTPLRESNMADLWTIDARISFDARGGKPVELQFHIPAVENGYETVSEIFIANGYGQSIFDDGDNRLAVWTARRVSGRQTLFYRLTLARSAESRVSAPGEIWCTPLPVHETEKLAFDALLSEIRQKSVDTISFITTAIQKLNDTSDANVRLLLRADASRENRFKVLEVLLSQAHIPVQSAHMLRLENGAQEPELWLRSYIDSAKYHDTDWYYFNLERYTKGVPENRLLWWVGTAPLVSSSLAAKPGVDFSIDRNELTIRSFERVAGGGDFSLYSLPISTQFAYKLMLMIPFGVLMILVIRNIIGIETLGTFTPVLIALAFRETGLVFGVVFFTIIVSLGLLVRAYLEQLKLQMLPRLSIVLTVVILMIIGGSMLCYKLGFTKGLSITLFPMVIVTMAIERLAIAWEERGGANTFRVAVGTLLSAAGVYLVLNIRPLTYLVFTFPTILLVLVAAMLFLGRYRGYRLTELIRFRDLLDKG